MEKRKLNYRDLSKEYLIELGIKDIQQTTEHQSGWRIIRTSPFKGHNETKIFLFTTQRFKNGGIRQAWYTQLYDKKEKKQRLFSLASVLYAWFIGTVPATMCVDHIDEDNMNESLDNYQLLTRGENVHKSAMFRYDKYGVAYRNQYTPLDQRKYQPK